MWRSMDPTQTSSPLFPTKNNLVSIFENIAFLDYFGVLRSANTGPKTRKRMQRTSFFIFSENCQNIETAYLQIWIKKKKLKQRYFFVKFIRLPVVFRVQGCFHWLSSPIGSVVIADHLFAGH